MGNNEEKTYRRGGYKKALIVGIIVFAVQYGLSMAIWDDIATGQCADTLAWLLMFCFVTYLVIRAQKVSFSALIVIRFFFISALGLIFIWFKPWLIITELSAASSLGVLLLTLFRGWLSTLFVSITLYGVAYCTSLPGRKVQFIEVVRFLLVALLSATIALSFALLIILISQSIAFFPKELFHFLDGLFSQLAFGITYYYAIGLLLDDDGLLDISSSKQF